MALLCWDVLPASILESGWFSVLARFVAVNTILYVALSLFKIAPKIYVSDYVHRGGRRSETRSIHPDDPVEPYAAKVPLRRRPPA
ncbi:MAG: hypothetical protein KDB37_10870 [Ilumatobacter sp.]|nr:hypothetical protein [Ilumatobacter sp.]